MNPKLSPIGLNSGVLTDRQKEPFEASYNSIIVVNAHSPFIKVPKDAALTIRTLSELRKKDWRSTNRWNSEGDYIGWLGELAMQRYCDIPASQALAEFETGLRGDSGYDLISNGLKIDCKATKGSAKKYKFSKTNKNTIKADAYAFVYIEDGAFESRAYLLGWSHRADIQPFKRFDGQKDFVRAETLKRAGVLNPVSMLREQHHQTVSSNTEQTINE